MSTSRFLPTILHPKSLTIASRILINVGAAVDRAVPLPRLLLDIRLPRLLRDIRRLPKVVLSKVPALATLTIVRFIGATSDTAATAFSIGLGNTGSDFVVRLSSTQKGTLVEKRHPRPRRRTI